MQVYCFGCPNGQFWVMAEVVREPHTISKEAAKRVGQVSRGLLLFSLISLSVTALAGCLLRAYPFLSVIPFDYKNLLHGHSHLAFGGWLMPVVLALLLQTFPELAQLVPLYRWRILARMLMVGALGMIVFFPLQGYGLCSILFSTLSTAGGIYMAWLCLRAMKVAAVHNVPYTYLKWGFAWMLLSFIGPFATGPLIAAGMKGTEIYYGAIYFYLHFQYNGWFLCVLLALIYRVLQQNNIPARFGMASAHLFALTCVPAFALSILQWQPGWIFNVVGGMAAAVQVVAAILLLRDLVGAITLLPVKWAGGVVVASLVMKMMLQLFSAFPFTASIAFGHNLVIAYLHLVLVGLLSTGFLLLVLKQWELPVHTGLRNGFAIFLIAFAVTESLLVYSGLGGRLQLLPGLFLAAALGMLAGVLVLFYFTWRQFALPKRYNAWLHRSTFPTRPIQRIHS